MLEACKKTRYLIGRFCKIFDIRHSNFSRRSRSGNGALFMVEFGQILPFSSNHSGLFFLISSEICWDIELIFITCLCYYIVVLKKNPGKVLKKQKLGQTQNEAQFFWK